MKFLPLLCLSVLLLAGCATSDSAKERPNPAGVYRETINIPRVMYAWEEFALRADGGGSQRMSMVIGKSKSKPKGEINEYFEGQGKWRFRGDKLVFRDNRTRAWPSPFIYLQSLLMPNKPLTIEDIFEIDENGDLLRIPPIGHPYYAGRFVKQK
jgi:hypothetical protein